MKHVVVVGAGAAGLHSAKCLLELNSNHRQANAERLQQQEREECHITLLEADDTVGGRVRADRTFLPPHVLDLGAEFIHGDQTLLTDLIEELGVLKEENTLPPTPMVAAAKTTSLLEDIYILAHADGGPDPQPTKDGKYGMYYVDQQLKRYDDPSLQRLHDVLSDMLEEPAIDDNTIPSVGAYLDALDPPLSDSMRRLAIASYGNSAACADLHQLSLPMIRRFEKHWEDNEVQADYRLPSTIGLHGLFDTLVQRLQQRHAPRHFELRLQCKVTQIEPLSNGRQVEIFVRAADQQQQEEQRLVADAVILAIPPPALQQLQLPLQANKQRALNHVGFHGAVKVILQFSHCLWPSAVQSIVCADGLPSPEIWFRELDLVRPPSSRTNGRSRAGTTMTMAAPMGDSDDSNKSFLAVAFMASQAADDFVRQCKKDPTAITSDDDQQQQLCSTKAAQLIMAQLAQVFSLPLSQVQAAFIKVLVYNWQSHATIQGSYMHPRVGMTEQHVQDLAAPQGRLFFAGEAMNTNASCTVQAAMETGQRAARQVWGLFQKEKDEPGSSTASSHY